MVDNLFSNIDFKRRRLRKYNEIDYSEWSANNILKDSITIFKNYCNWVLKLSKTWDTGIFALWFHIQFVLKEVDCVSSNK